MQLSYNRELGTWVADPEPEPPAKKKRKKKDAKTGPIALIIKVVAKFGPTLLKLLKFSKFALAGASLAAYSLLFTWQFGVVLMGAIFIHEYTHVLVMKHYGLKVKGMYFIPLIGAAAVTEDEFPNRKVESVTAYAGPFSGLVLALIGLGIYAVTHSGFIAAVTGFVALLNLFNLLPVSPLDGGRVAKSLVMSVSSRLGIIFMLGGILLAAAVAWKLQLIIFVIILPLAVIDLLVERSKHKKGKSAPPLSRRQGWTMLASYVALAVSLVGIMFLMQHEPGAAAALHALQG